MWEKYIMKRKLIIINVLCLMLAFLVPRGAFSYDLAKKVKMFTLKNGMRWIVVQRKQMPVVSGVIMVRTGGADEEKGKTGIAHMFEHMAFKGSRNIGTKDFAKEA